MRSLIIGCIFRNNWPIPLIAKPALLKIIVISAVLCFSLFNGVEISACTPFDISVSPNKTTSAKWGVMLQGSLCGMNGSYEQLGNNNCPGGNPYVGYLRNRFFTTYASYSLNTVDWSANVATGGWTWTEQHDWFPTYADCNDGTPESMTLTNVEVYVCYIPKGTLADCCANNDADGDGFHDSYGYDCNTGGASQLPPNSDDGKPDGGTPCD